MKKEAQDKIKADMKALDKEAKKKSKSESKEKKKETKEPKEKKEKKKRSRYFIFTIPFFLLFCCCTRGAGGLVGIIAQLFVSFLCSLLLVNILIWSAIW